jgi:hypothetical protein
MYDSKYGFFDDPLTERKICGSCFDGKHKACMKGDCRCLHHFTERKRRVVKDTSLQTDMSQFGNIEV